MQTERKIVPVITVIGTIFFTSAPLSVAIFITSPTLSVNQGEKNFDTCSFKQNRLKTVLNKESFIYQQNRLVGNRNLVEIII